MRYDCCILLYVPNAKNMYLGLVSHRWMQVEQPYNYFGYGDFKQRHKGFLALPVKLKKKLNGIMQLFLLPCYNLPDGKTESQGKQVIQLRKGRQKPGRGHIPIRKLKLLYLAEKQEGDLQ